MDQPQSTPAAARLVTAPNLDAPDDFYEALIESHQGLSNEDSHALNARLVLVLANHIGALPVLREALAAARRTSAPTQPATNPKPDTPAPKETTP